MTEDTREQGVEFGELGEKLQKHDYPADQEEILDEYGDETLELSDDESVTLEETIGPMGVDEYESYHELEQSIMNMVGDEAIGRKNYSDRTPPAPGEDRQDEGAPGQDDQEEQESF